MKSEGFSSYRPNFFAESMGIRVGDRGDRKNAKSNNPASRGCWTLGEDLNDIEQEYVKNIFKDYKTSFYDSVNYYLDIRKKIICLYDKDITRYITPRDCINAIDADAATIVKVFCLLNYWGVINYAALRKFTKEDYQLSTFKREIDSIKSKYSSKNECDIQDFLPTFTNDYEGEHNKRRIKTEPDEFKHVNRPFFAKNISKVKPPETIKAAKKCYSCQAQCKYTYFMLVETVLGEKLQKYKDAIWCLNCYSNSLYPLDLPRNLLARVMVPIGSEYAPHVFVGKKWSKKKFEKLYEAVDKAGLNWEMVQQEVGDDVTSRECMYQFLIAPLEKELEEDIPLPGCFSSIANVKNEIPFYNNPNPVTTFLSFCSSVLSPIVASRAAKVILDYVMNGDANEGNSLTERNEWNTNDQQRMDANNQVYRDMYQVNQPHPLGELYNMNMGAGMFPKRTDAFMPPEPMSEWVPMAHGMPQENNIPMRINGNNPTISEATLYAAFKEGIQSSRDTCAEIAEMEQENVNELLQKLIKLKIKRVKEKLRKFSVTEEKIDNSNIKMLYHLSTLLKPEEDM